MPFRSSSCKAAEPVGFATWCARVASAAQPRIDYRMAEFFIARAAAAAWDRADRRAADPRVASPGAGKSREYLRNAGAVNFWRRVVAAYTQGSYQERIVNGEVRQVFESGTPRRR